MVRLPQQEDKETRVFVTVAVMSFLMLIILGGFFIMYDKGFQLDKFLGLERSASLSLTNITIWDSNTAQEAVVDPSVKRSLQDLMQRYGEQLSHLEIRVSGLQTDSKLGPATGSVVYVLQMRFQNGSIIRTRARSSQGNRFTADVARDMRTGSQQFDKLMREGVIGWDRPGRVINI